MIPPLSHVSVTLMDNTHVHGMYAGFDKGHHEIVNDDATWIYIPVGAVKFLEHFPDYEGPDDDGGEDPMPDPTGPPPHNAYLFFFEREK